MLGFAVSDPKKPETRKEKKNRILERNKRHNAVNLLAQRQEAEAAAIQQAEQARIEGLSGAAEGQVNWANKVVGETPVSDSVKQIRANLDLSRARARSRWHHFRTSGGGTIGR